MISYRGTNGKDNICLFDKNSNSIKCNIDSIDITTKKEKKIYTEIHCCEMSLSLDRTIGHVSGKNIDGSGWISTSLDYNFVATEYAIPQAGKYNLYPYRKNIIVIDSNNEIGVSNLANRSIPSDNFVGEYINLFNNSLTSLVNSGFIKALYQNEKSYYYNIWKNILNEINGIDRVNVNGFSNFASFAKECLFYREIPKDNIVKVLSPLEQDLIYIETHGKSIEEANRIVLACIDKYKNLDLSDYNFTIEEQNLINWIYNKSETGIYYCLINLIPLFYKENDTIKVDELYEILKYIKRDILAKISGYKDIPLVDDTIYALRYEHIKNKVLPNGTPINNTNKNDIIYQVDKNKKLVRNCGKK